jgi:hypothetical protein
MKNNTFFISGMAALAFLFALIGCPSGGEDGDPLSVSYSGYAGGKTYRTATAMGEAAITGTVANGLAVGTPFIKDVPVSVKGPLVAKGPNNAFVVRDIAGGGVELVQYLGNDANVTIPGDLGITETYGAFFENFNLISVTLPRSLRVIGWNTFHACSNLATITIPSGVTTIGNYAFFNCYSLTSMKVEAGTPPEVEGQGLFPRDLTPPGLTAIYVPAASVAAYKNAEGWKKHADIIQAITP